MRKARKSHPIFTGVPMISMKVRKRDRTYFFRFETLSQLKKAKLKSTYKIRKSEGKYFVDVTVKNVSGSIAFFNQLQFLNQDLKPIRPSFYTDNFFSLMPGESKFVVIETNAEKIIEKPVIVVKGWNVDRKQINK